MINIRAELENLTGGDTDLIKNTTEEYKRLEELFKDTHCDHQVCTQVKEKIMPKGQQLQGWAKKVSG